jgi:broad specificity phosphatase PhoE
MALPAAQLTLELIPHCTSVTRDGWTTSHDVRPLAEPGMRQAAALVAAIGTGIDGIYSSPTARCRQTVGPLAAAAGLPVLLAALSSAFDIPQPRHVGRGGWYTLQFVPGALAITAHDPVPVRTDSR